MAQQNPEWSANTTAYFELWKKTLHQNCKGKDKCSCHEGAYRLTLDRLDCIARGMPDLHPTEEAKIWDTTFDIHRVACHDLPGRRPGCISPTWMNPKDISGNIVCDCFEKAMWLHQFIDEHTPEQKKPAPPQFVYDPYSQEREV